MAKTFYLISGLVLLLLSVVPLRSGAQMLALKTNMLYDMLLTPSLSVEGVVSSHATLNLTGSWMPLRINPDCYWRTFSVQPEFRYWPAVPLAGPFVGVAWQYRGFNLGGLSFSHLKDSRSQGHMQGGGVTLGWHHILTTRWSIEYSLLVGWAHLKWDHYDSPRSDVVVSHWRANYIGPLDLGLNLVYIIK